MTDALTAALDDQSLFWDAVFTVQQQESLERLTANELDLFLSLLVTSRQWSALSADEGLRVLYFVCLALRRLPPELVLAHCGRLGLRYRKIVDELQQDNVLVATVFDALRICWYGSAHETIEVRHLRSTLLQPFLDFVRRIDHGSRPLSRHQRRLRHRLCFLCHNPSWGRGQALGAITARLALGMAEHAPDSEIYLYMVRPCSDEFREAFEGSGVRLYSADKDLDHAQYSETIAAWLEENEIGILVADVCSSLSARLFEHRVAPVQAYHDPAQPYWDSGELDWVFHGVENEHWLGYRRNRTELLAPFVLNPTRYARPPDVAAAAAFRSAFPSGSFLFAVFTRYAKISWEYLEILEKILERNPNSFICLFGEGDAGAIEKFFAGKALISRVYFSARNVDLYTYCGAVDAFLDTFPFPGGSAVQEANFYGLPVVTLANNLYRRYFGYTRDAALLAEHPQAYLALAGRLASEPAFLASCRTRAKEIGQQQLDIARVVAAMDAAFGRLWTRQLAVWEGFGDGNLHAAHS
jgi:hypothetical protein